MNCNATSSEPSDEMRYGHAEPRRAALDISDSSDFPDRVGEEHKALAQELVEKLVDSGLFRTWVPDPVNGVQAPPAIMLFSADDIAREKVSTDWCVVIAMPSRLLGAHLPPKGAEGVSGDPRSVSVGVWTPVGGTEATEGDVSASGHWSFYSGVFQSDGLSQAEAQAALHKALIELVTGLPPQKGDGAEPRSAPSLAQAAKDLVQAYLADARLSPAMLARELNVSVRTLQRAFAATGDSVTAYIRHQRLEAARIALTSPKGRPSVSELAAHWQFADSSHFIKAFKQRYGQTPAQYARSHSRTATSGSSARSRGCTSRSDSARPHRRSR